MPTKLTDDLRILFALKGGYDVRRYYRAGFKFRRAPEYWCAIQDVGDKDSKWHRSVSLSSIERCVDAGLIAKNDDTYDGSYGNDITHRLTDAGQAAVDAITDISVAKAIAPPKPSKPKPERTYEERQMDKKNGYVRGTLRHLVKANMRVVRTPPNARGYWSWQWYPMDETWVINRRWADCRDVFVLMPLLEEFESPVDGMTSLRPNAEGLEIIAKRRPLPDHLDIKV